MVKNISTLILLMIGFQITAQTDSEVFRIEQLNYNTSVYNIFIDQNNNKQVGTNEGIYTVYGKDLANAITTEPGRQYLLSFKGGNADLSWSKAEMQSILEAQNSGIRDITTASYDKKNQELWVGTKENGAFKFKLEPSLQLLEHFTNKTSKLESNEINVVHVDNFDRIWIGTRSGILMGEDGKWKLEEKFLSFENIAEEGPELWLLAEENFIWKVDMRGKWEEFYVEEEWVEGNALDIDIDGKGWLWIASEVVTGYDVVADSFVRFGPAQYFTSQFTNCITVDFEGNVWVGTDDKGLYMIENEPGMAVVAYAENFLSCDGTKQDASIVLKVASGEPPYKIEWEKGLQGYNPKNLGPGTYKVTVTDNRGKKKIAMVVIPKPKMEVTATVEQMESKIGKEDGIVSLVIEGGVPGYDVQWDNGATGMRAENLAGGKHTVTITDQNNCTTTAEINVTQKLEDLQVVLTQTVKNKCASDKNGAIEASVTGGKPPYTYEWNNPLLKGTNPTGLFGGNYKLIVTDAAGNEAQASIQLDQPEPLVAKVTVEASATANQEDGEASVVVSGGVEKYQIAWSNGSEGERVDNLGAGSYSVTVTDKIGCTATDEFNVSEDILPLSVSFEIQQSNKCFGQTDVALNLEVKGGKTPYRYVWNNPNLSEDKLTGLKAGRYVVTVYDVLGTAEKASLTVTDPNPLKLETKVISSANTGEEDGSAKAIANGGTGKYSYLWDNGESDGTAKNLAAGVHTVTVTDENGCTATGEVEITEDILPLRLTINQTSEINCNGGKTASLEAEVTGGKKPHQWLWSEGGGTDKQLSGLAAGAYEVTVTDALGTTIAETFSVQEPSAIAVKVEADQPANTGEADGQASVLASGGTGKYEIAWDNGENGTQAKKLSPGVHTVTVTDENGCTATGEVEITEDILPLKLSINQTGEIECHGTSTASLEVSASGGKKPFKFTWNNSALSGTSLSNLKAGTYSVTLTDVTGTNISKDITISEPSPLELKVEADRSASTGGSDGQATAIIAGGAGEYSISWDNGETTARAEKLTPGIHSVTVTDKNGCTVSGDVEINENILPLTVNIGVTADIPCYGSPNGSIKATISGGKQPYQLTWNDSRYEGEELTNLPAGTYSITVSDVSGQSAESSVILSEPDELVVQIVDKRAAMNDRTTDGKATLRARGGTPPYDILWDSEETGEKAIDLSSGKHQVTVTDANNCQTVIAFEIRERIIPELNVDLLNEGTTIRMKTLTFQADSTDLDERSFPVLDEVYFFLTENPGIVVEIGGHTNTVPEPEFCDWLSTERAKAVVEYLVEAGISPDRLTYKGYGKRKPLVRNDKYNMEARKRNQRVEIKILRLEGD